MTEWVPSPPRSGLPWVSQASRPAWALSSSASTLAWARVEGVSGASVGTGVINAIAGVGSDVVSGAGELAGNAVVAAPGPGPFRPSLLRVLDLYPAEPSCGHDHGRGLPLGHLLDDVLLEVWPETLILPKPSFF